jgi:hypothetical protein
MYLLYSTLEMTDLRAELQYVNASVLHLLAFSHPPSQLVAPNPNSPCVLPLFDLCCELYCSWIVSMFRSWEAFSIGWTFQPVNCIVTCELTNIQLIEVRFV